MDTIAAGTYAAGMNEYDVVIVGASIAGVALVLALRDADMRVALVDRVESFDERRLNWGHDLQPNALLALERLGVLEQVISQGARHEHWYTQAVGGRLLSRWDYADLRVAHPYAVCIRPHVLRDLLRDAASTVNGVDMLIPSTFEGVEPAVNGHGHNVTIDSTDGRRVLRTRLLIGADGPRSRVRELAGIGSSVRQYRHSWADTIFARADDEVTEGHIMFGRGIYLGIVPTRGRELVTFELTDTCSHADYQQRYGDVAQFRDRYRRLAPVLADCIDNVTSYDQMSWTPSVRARADRWVADGIALVGDATITVNPIASQGVCLALEGAAALGTIIRQCHERGDFSAAALAPYESWRRPAAEAIQELGDQCAWGFAHQNSMLNALKLAMFSRLQRDRRMRSYVMSAFCGLHWLTPQRLRFIDVLASIGAWPRSATAFWAVDRELAHLDHAAATTRSCARRARHGASHFEDLSRRTAEEHHEADGGRDVEEADVRNGLRE